MFKYIKVQNDTIVSIQESRRIVISDELHLIDADVKVEIGDLYFNGTVTATVKSLASEIEERIALIKQEAAIRIIATDWQLQREEERNRRGKKSQTDVDTVLDMRDKIRTDSDIAELSVMALTTIEEAKSFTW